MSEAASVDLQAHAVVASRIDSALWVAGTTFLFALAAVLVLSRSDFARAQAPGFVLRFWVWLGGMPFVGWSIMVAGAGLAGVAYCFGSHGGRPRTYPRLLAASSGGLIGLTVLALLGIMVQFRDRFPAEAEVRVGRTVGIVVALGLPCLLGRVFGRRRL